MTSTISLSVIILTKNRAALLKKCLNSLEGQLSHSDEIIIVDNNSIDKTQSVIRRYKHKLPIHSFKTMVSGYPKLYNLAVSKSTKAILVFLDDDCEATKNFIMRIREKYFIKTDFVLQGKTLSLPRNNVLAEISEDHLSDWIDGNTIEGNRLSVIDNRNVAIPKHIFKKTGPFSVDMKAGSEDVELGRRLFRAGIPIIYDPLIVAFHNERTGLKTFLVQHARIAKSHAILDATFIKEQKISILNRYTWRRHIRSLFSREAEYWCKKRYKDLFYLPFVYLLLVIVRIFWYLRLFR